MCIRDRDTAMNKGDSEPLACERTAFAAKLQELLKAHAGNCLLYTSDAADERSSVDLGGRRIIKKKNTASLAMRGGTISKN